MVTIILKELGGLCTLHMCCTVNSAVHSTLRASQVKRSVKRNFNAVFDLYRQASDFISNKTFKDPHLKIRNFIYCAVKEKICSKDDVFRICLINSCRLFRIFFTKHLNYFGNLVITYEYKIRLQKAANKLAE
jgi:hypothetical protein